MKRFRLMALALVLFAATATPVLSAGTATVNVTATVLGSCSFDTTTYTMAFGAIDPLADAGDKTASINLAFNCSNGTPFSLGNVSGAQTLAGAVAGGTLPYSVNNYPLTGTGTGATQNLTITARIAELDYTTAPADSYTDTLTININP
jgi:spore coat protein U-like protein